MPLNALPSFIISISVFRFDKQPFAIITMFAAIAIFVLGLATIAAMIPDLNRDGHPLKRGLRAAMTFRAWISGLSSAMLVIAPPVMTLIPDFWCGYISAAFAEGLLQALHLGSSGVRTGSFLPVMLTTTLEGLIIAIAIAMMTFFLCLYFQNRERRKAFTSAGSPTHLRRSS